MTLRNLLLAGFISSLVLLGSCQPQAIPATPAANSEPWPEFDYARATRQGKNVYHLVPALSQVDILVRREGPLARFGHDHLVSLRNAEGYLLLETDSASSSAELRFRADELDIDPADSRVRYRLDTDPDAEDIEATRRNLLDRVLDAENWPYIRLKLAGFDQKGVEHTAAASFMVRDSSSNSPVKFRLEASATQVLIEGEIDILQSDLGIEPFSILGGGLRVSDQLEVHFRLLGERTE